MSSFRLFFSRLVKEWLFQFRIFKMILDWTVMLYIAIPAILIFSFTYKSWWSELPDWITFVPLGAVFLVLYLFSWQGQVRTFVQDADQMFLLKHRRLFLNMKITALLYSILSQAVILLFLIIILLPFLLNYYLLTLWEILMLFLIFFTLKLLIMALKIEIKKIISSFIQKVVSSINFIIFGFLVMYAYRYWIEGKLTLLFLLCIIGLVISRKIIFPYVKMQSEFNNHLLIEKMERTKYINVILNFSSEVEKTNVITRKRPFFFRKSQRIFKRRSETRGLLELFTKVFMRNPLYIVSYFQIVGISMIAIINLPPMWVKIMIFLGGVFFIHIWTNLVWEKVTSGHPLTKKFSEYDCYFKAKRIATSILTIIGTIALLSSLLIANIINNYISNLLGNI